MTLREKKDRLRKSIHDMINTTHCEKQWLECLISIEMTVDEMVGYGFYDEAVKILDTIE